MRPSDPFFPYVAALAVGITVGAIAHSGIVAGIVAVLFVAAWRTYEARHR
jgi:hypothetical protein